MARTRIGELLVSGGQLDVGRITSDKLELRKERVDLATVLRDAIEMCRPLVQQFEHDLMLVAREPIAVEADPARLGVTGARDAGHDLASEARRDEDVVLGDADERRAAYGSEAVERVVGGDRFALPKKSGQGLRVRVCQRVL